MLYPYLPVVGFIAMVLVLFPLPRQIRVQNVAIILASFWLFGVCLIQSVNALIWAGNVRDCAPVWCDISTYFQVASIVGLPAATFCVCKHLELISSKRPISSYGNPLRRKIFESVMCFGLPCLWLFVYYSFQNARYLIIEDFGCSPVSLRSYVTVGILISLPMILSVGTLIYGSIALYHLIKHHKATSRLLTPHLKSRDAAISWAQYHRVMAMSLVVGIWGLAWLIIDIRFHLEGPSDPLESWKAIHSTDSTVIEIPATMFQPKDIHRSLLLWWSFPASAYAYFLLFSTSYEVWSEYQKFWGWFRTTILRSPVPDKSVTLLGSDPSPVLWIHKDATIGNDLELPVVHIHH